MPDMYGFKEVVYQIYNGFNLVLYKIYTVSISFNLY